MLSQTCRLNLVGEVVHKKAFLRKPFDNGFRKGLRGNAFVEPSSMESEMATFPQPSLLSGLDPVPGKELWIRICEVNVFDSSLPEIVVEKHNFRLEKFIQRMTHHMHVEQIDWLFEKENNYINTIYLSIIITRNKEQ
ncbi:hypothetical protein AVEN_115257-1 [Araneus ventricosus]|uniref:Uncharacterized protein n=1 Tax=Araneus ventricosus TaxID=182803 RepID=A0A4Y1ZY16_ARAVE|nr:hypothetical protein AVEN_115257-1 [Araneus ventricosus]